MPLLDLTEREDSSAVPAGRYRVSIEECEERFTSGSGKMPEGIPMVWMQLNIEEPLFEPTDNEGKPVNTVGRKVFNQIVIAPPDYPQYKMMNGIMFRSLLAFGYTKDELESGEFDLDYNDLKGREAIATVTRREYTDPDTEEVIISNSVKGLKPAGETSGVV